MQNYVLHNWSIVRGGTSSAQKSLFFNLRRLRAKLAQEGDSRTGTEVFGQIAEVLGVSRSDVEVMDARLSGPDVSLNAPIGDSESAAAVERMTMLVDDKPRPDEVVGLVLDTDRRVAWLNEALTALSERERRILRARRLADEAATLEALGDRLGISKERVPPDREPGHGKIARGANQTPHGKRLGSHALTLRRRASAGGDQAAEKPSNFSDKDLLQLILTAIATFGDNAVQSM